MPRKRARARALFAAALETPGGLKVQTIHAFCTRLLQQFPFEANVAARFTVLDDHSQNEMFERAIMAVLLQAAGAPDERARPRSPARRDRRRRLDRPREAAGSDQASARTITRWLDAAGSVERGDRAALRARSASIPRTISP